MSLPAELQDGNPEIGVLADGVARPPPGRLECGATNEAHCDVNEYCLRLVALEHAETKETGVFPVPGGVGRTAPAVAVNLRRLPQPDFGVSKRGHQVDEPIRSYRIVGVDDADDFG